MVMHSRPDWAVMHHHRPQSASPPKFWAVMRRNHRALGNDVGSNIAHHRGGVVTASVNIY
ncbi:UNVERIFIED_CONTAM: hypothetical protein Sradi_5289600 [Sesamum radiatum]|uniref:Uncharacterized protein n=1 Tax=Sesamum radiatum TaxID=300843 RepID=A0AAW2LMG7_SESRA